MLPALRIQSMVRAASDAIHSISVHAPLRGAFGRISGVSDLSILSRPPSNPSAAFRILYFKLILILGKLQEGFEAPEGEDGGGALVDEEETF
jgi:hypothetical protein